MYTIKNISDGQIVCTLADKTTLRLNIEETVEIADSKVTDHVKHLSEIGRLLLEKKANKKKKKED